jgi:sec-independent protein translocase protein TatC
MMDMNEDALLGGLREHFEELRSRLLKSLLALGVAVILSFFITEYVIGFLVQPIGGLEKLQSIEVTENLTVFMKVSLLTGFIIALPIIAYQIMAFILPGLKPSEKKWLIFYIPFVVIMFIAGVAFAYFVMLQAAIPFLINYLGVETVPRISNYISFVTNLLFWTGVSFEAPIIILILAKLRIVNAVMLLRGWRIAIVVIAILSAIITPTTDPVNMALLMAPLMGLYLISILLAFLVR